MASDNHVLQAHIPPDSAVTQILQPAMPVAQPETVLAATMLKEILPNLQSHQHR